MAVWKAYGAWKANQRMLQSVLEIHESCAATLLQKMALRERGLEGERRLLFP